jgi:hypothetical protein
MPHTHNIDGKLVTFEDATCPYCHPNAQQPQQQQQQEILPRVYTKGQTAVAKLSKKQLISTTYWAKGECLLMNISNMRCTNSGVPIKDAENKVIWDKQTAKVSLTTMTEYVNEIAKLIATVQSPTPVPARD